MATLAPYFGLVGIFCVVTGLALIAQGFERGLLHKLGAAVGVPILILGGMFGWQAIKPVPLAHAAPGKVPAVAIGDRYLDFTAKDSTGADVTLSSLEGQPILLKFFRGHW